MAATGLQVKLNTLTGCQWIFCLESQVHEAVAALLVNEARKKMLLAAPVRNIHAHNDVPGGQAGDTNGIYAGSGAVSTSALAESTVCHACGTHEEAAALAGVQRVGDANVNLVGVLLRLCVVSECFG